MRNHETDSRKNADEKFIGRMKAITVGALLGSAVLSGAMWGQSMEKSNYDDIEKSTDIEATFEGEWEAYNGNIVFDDIEDRYVIFLEPLDDTDAQDFEAGWYEVNPEDLVSTVQE